MKFFSVFSYFFLALFVSAQDKSTLRGLLVTGGGHHDYATQKNLITKGISERINVEWKILFEMDPRRMKGLWVLMTGQGIRFYFYNFCFGEDDTDFIKIVAVHKGGMPVVAMHCASTYHPYVKEKKKSWNKMLGVVSSGHGPHVPYDVSIVPKHANHPVVEGLPSKWRTPKGELLHGTYRSGGNDLL